MTTIPAHFPLRSTLCFSSLSPFKLPPTVFFGCASLLLLSERNYFFSRASPNASRVACRAEPSQRHKKKQKESTCCCSERCLIACLFDFNLKVFPFQIKLRRTPRESERLLPSVGGGEEKKIEPIFPHFHGKKRQKKSQTQ